MRRALQAILLASILGASGLATADQSLTCSTLPLAFQVGCYYETPILTVGEFELAFGADANLNTRDQSLVSIAPYLVLAQYAGGYSWWVEVRVPKLGGVPILGSPDPLRVGFSINW